MKASPLAVRSVRLRFNRTLRSKSVPAKACGHCFTVKVNAAFPKGSSLCGTCHRTASTVRQRVRYATDPGCREMYRAANQRRRARIARAPHEPYSRSEIFARWGGACCYCDAPAEHLDHVHALSRGGADAAHNLVPACAPCNLSKGAKSLAEWALA